MSRDRWEWDWDLAEEPPPSRLEQWLALRALGLLLLLLAAVLVIVGFWLLVRFAVEPQPYQDPESLGAPAACALTSYCP